MKVEQEYFFLASLRSVQRRRRRSGTRVDIACAKIGVDHQGVELLGALLAAHAGCTTSLEEDLLHRLGHAEADAQLPGYPRHRLHHSAAAAAGMEYAKFVLHERQDGEQAGAAKWRHPKILRLKREREPHAFVAEVGGQVLVDAAMRPHQPQRAEHVGAEQIPHAMERRLEDRAECRQLGAVVGHEAGQGSGVAGGKAADFGGKTRRVVGCLDLAAGLEHEAVLRIKPNQIDLALELAAACGENIRQHARVEEEGGAHIKPEGAVFGGCLDRGRTAPEPRVAFVDGDVGARLGHEHCGCQASWAGSYDADPALPSRSGQPRTSAMGEGRRDSGADCIVKAYLLSDTPDQGVRTDLGSMCTLSPSGRCAFSSGWPGDHRTHAFK